MKINYRNLGKLTVTDSLGDWNTEFRSGPLYVQELASANGGAGSHTEER